MHKRVFVALMALALAAPVAQADTIHLKNGSVLKGKVASFADDQFIIMLDTGSGRYLSRAMVFVGDVARIEFENAPAGAADSASHDTSPAPRPSESAPVRDSTTRPNDTAIGVPPRDTTTPRDAERSTILPDTPRNTQPEKQPRDTDASEAQPVHQADSTPAEKPAESKPNKSFDRPADSD